MRNLQEQVIKVFCYQKLFWPFTVIINCSSDLKIFANSWPLASNFKRFSRSLEQFFLTVGQNNFGNKIPIIRKISWGMSLFIISLVFRVSDLIRDWRWSQIERKFWDFLTFLKSLDIRVLVPVNGNSNSGTARHCCQNHRVYRNFSFKNVGIETEMEIYHLCLQLKFD